MTKQVMMMLWSALVVFSNTVTAFTSVTVMAWPTSLLVGFKTASILNWFSMASFENGCISYVLVTSFLLVVTSTVLCLQNSDLVSSGIRTSSSRNSLSFFLLSSLLIVMLFFTNSLMLFLLLFEALTAVLFMTIMHMGSEISSFSAGQVFMLYSMLSGALLLFVTALNTFKPPISCTNFSPNMLTLVSVILLMTAFSIKIPLYPFHSWLPFAHAEASTENSVMLTAGVLKLSIMGFISFMSQWQSSLCSFSWLVYAIIMCTLTILAGVAHGIHTNNLKKVIASSSMVHMAPILMILLSGTSSTMTSYIQWYLVSHSFVSSSLFMYSGVFLYTAKKSYNTNVGSGAGKQLKLLITLLTLSNMSLPCSVMFYSELGLIKCLLEQVDLLATMMMTFGLVMGTLLMSLKLFFSCDLPSPADSITVSNIFGFNWSLKSIIFVLLLSNLILGFIFVLMV